MSGEEEGGEMSGLESTIVVCVNYDRLKFIVLWGLEEWDGQSWIFG